MRAGAVAARCHCRSRCRCRCRACRSLPLLTDARTAPAAAIGSSAVLIQALGGAGGAPAGRGTGETALGLGQQGRAAVGLARPAIGPRPPACRRGSRRGRRAAGSCRWRSWESLPALTSTIASTARSCSAATARRIASKTSSSGRCLRRSISCTTTSCSPAVDLDGERRARSPGRRRGWLCCDGQLDVLRIVVHAADDDQVLEPAGDEQLAVAHEAQVAGAQEGPLAGVRQVGRGRSASRGLGLLPVALGHAGAADPDLADRLRRAECHGLGVGDDDLLVRQRTARSRPAAGRPRRRARRRARGGWPGPRPRSCG